MVIGVYHRHTSCLHQTTVSACQQTITCNILGVDEVQKKQGALNTQLCCNQLQLCKQII